MSSPNDELRSADPFDLDRFVEAQRYMYARAVAEITAGQKQTHWMWFILPQLDGLGSSSTSKRFGIKEPEEARAYLNHPILGPRLLECADAALRVEGKSAKKIFGDPDYLKLRSCASLFACLQPPGSLFDRLLRRFYGGKPDRRTLELLGIDSSCDNWQGACGS